MAMAQNKLERLEKLLTGISRTQQNSTDFETADATARDIEFALELLSDYRAELEPEVTEERIAA
jgi:hypothetical protein